jgi:integrase
LTEEAEGRGANEALLHVPSHPARDLGKDLTAAGIPKWTPEGKTDFHAFRATYTTLVLEAGANAKEAQALARHSTPALTMDLYARARPHRLHAIVEAASSRVFGHSDHEHSS